jgi:leucyl-tRNA synthetase
MYVIVTCNVQPIIKEYGADTVRLFMLFKAPPENVLEWDLRGIQGQYRWINRIWTLVGAIVTQHTASGAAAASRPSVATSAVYATLPAAEKNLLSVTHQCIKQVSHCMEIEQHAFNVAIAELMKLSNALAECSDELKRTQTFYECLRCMIIMLAPMAPHVAAELWQALVLHGPAVASDWSGDSASQNVHSQRWPQSNAALIIASEVTLVIMVTAASH